MPSRAHEHEIDEPNPTSIAEAADVPSIEISPPPSPPARAHTEEPSISAVVQPLSRKDFVTLCTSVG
jgi:hypothetical protein